MTTGDESRPSRRERAVAVAREGAKLLGVAAIKIVSRTLAWGSLGLVLGLIAWNALYWPGLLEIDWAPWAWLVWALLLIYLVAGAGGLGYVGFFRGLGRTLLYVGIERGLVVALVDQLLERLVAGVRRVGAMERALERSERFLENLPLQRWEEGLKQAVDSYLAESDEVADEKPGLRRRLARRMRELLCRRIERYLLKVVRKEIDEQGEGGGVSPARVREVALAQVEGWFEGAVVGMMNKYLLIGALILLIAFAIAPVTAAFL